MSQEERIARSQRAARPHRLGYSYLRKNHPDFPTSHYDRTKAFTGKTTSPIPKDMTGSVVLGGIELVLNAANPKRRQHRIMARCPKCSDLVPAGRLHQHVGVCQ
jgi:hypothetical protein